MTLYSCEAVCVWRARSAACVSCTLPSPAAFVSPAKFPYLPACHPLPLPQHCVPHLLLLLLPLLNFPAPVLFVKRSFIGAHRSSPSVSSPPGTAIHPTSGPQVAKSFAAPCVVSQHHTLITRAVRTLHAPAVKGYKGGDVRWLAGGISAPSAGHLAQSVVWAVQLSTGAAWHSLRAANYWAKRRAPQVVGDDIRG